MRNAVLPILKACNWNLACFVSNIWYCGDTYFVKWTWQLDNAWSLQVDCVCVLVGQLFRVVRIYVPKLGAVHHLCVTKPHPPSGHSLARSAAQHITLQYRKQLSELRRLPYLGETWHLWPQHRWHERDTRANQRPSTPPVSAFPLQIEICAHNDTHNDTHTDTQWHRHKL